MQESIHLSPCDHNKKRVIALGFFDGVHLGHQALLRRVVEVSRETGLEPAVFTFDRMPREYVTGRPVPLLTTVEERIEIIRALFPIETVIVEPFNAAMMTTSPLDFFRMLLEKHSAGWLVAGEDYTFGYKNAGRTDLLRELCRENGIGCDIITHINGREVDTIEQVQQIIKQDGSQPLTLQASRGDRALQLSVQPVKTSTGGYQLGVWLRDSMAGIGTMTFYDPDSGVFAALGHGINDADTAKLMPLESGSIMHASVSDVKKGAPGQPGELHGVFDLQKDMGALYANTEMGVFGTMDKGLLSQETDALPVASHDEIHEGHATILSNIEGDSVQEYDVKITHVYSRSAGKTRNMMLEVTDPRLLAATGGIVQGMSGSPILQNGRIVGAVTHVLVNDPTRGYGIFIENMLEAAGGASG